MDNSCLKKSKLIKLIIPIHKALQKELNKDWKHTYVSFLNNLKYVAPATMAHRGKKVIKI